MQNPENGCFLLVPWNLEASSSKYEVHKLIFLDWPRKNKKLNEPGGIRTPDPMVRSHVL